MQHARIEHDADRERESLGGGTLINRTPVPRQRGMAARRPRGHRQFLLIAADRRFALDGGGALRDVDHRLRDVGRARRPTRSTTPCSSATPGPATATWPGRWAQATRRRAGGRAWSGPGCPSTPTASSSCARTCSAAARARPARRRSTRPTAGRTARTLPGRHDPRHGAGAGPAGRPPRRRAVALACVGGSMGGMQVLEWAITYPDRVRSLVADRHLRAGHGPADRLGRHRPARRSGSTRTGAAATTTTPSPATARTRAWPIARMVAQVTFRSDNVFTDRFGRELADGRRLDDGLDLWQRFEVERYLDHHGDKLVRRFDANSYLVIGKAMDLHDVGRGRGGLDAGDGPDQGADAGDRHLERHALPDLPAAPDPPAARRHGHAVRVRRDRLAARPRRVPDRPRPGRRSRSPPSSTRSRTP